MKLSAVGLFIALALCGRGAFAHSSDGAQEAAISNTQNFTENNMERPGQIRTDAAAPAFEIPQFEARLHANCVEPKVAIDCCWYVIPDKPGGTNVTYKGIKDVYGSEADSRTFASQQIPRMPFFFPFATDDASVGQGWVYEAGDSHGSVDISKTDVAVNTDPSFKVLAAAPGRVVSKTWDNWHGNILVVEHTATNGTKYRTTYFHLRNGKRNDLANARAIPTPADGNKVVLKYIKYANLKDPSDVQWGTDSQKILVKLGDWVEAGQHIAWSGNTGPGGSGAGLKDDGTPSDTTRANNHLHFMLAVQNPKTTGEWIFIDPFGVYQKVSSGCTDVMKDNPYRRFFAPFYSNFHQINTDLLYKYMGYYPDMGMTMQTFSVYPTGEGVRAAGSFQAGAPSPWYAYGYQPTNDFAALIAARGKEGFRPWQLNVATAGDGQPRFTALWKKATEAWYVYVNMPDTDMDAKWQDLIVRQKYRLEDYATYSIGNERRHAAIFVKDDKPFSMFNNMTEQQYSAKFNEMAGQGWANISFNAGQFTWGERYSGVWTKPGGQWGLYFNMSRGGYQQRFEQLTSQGFRLYKIQGYANGTKFGAVWRK